MTSAKARRLAELAELVSVPPFRVCRRGAPVGAVPWELAMVRGCRAAEDGAVRSHAGASTSVGPVSRAAVAEVVARLFAEDPALVDVIVQRFVGGPSGVVLSLADDLALVEFTRSREGVTAGRVTPFVALLPTALPRYAALQRGVRAVHAAHGPCDLEFVDVDRPRFVQRRPLTASVEFDVELARTRMALQELEVARWGQVAYCVDLMEQPACDAALGALWAELLPRETAPFARAGGTDAPLPLLKVGAQFYVGLDALEACAPTPSGAFRIGAATPRFLRAARRDLASAEGGDARTWMRHSIRLNLVWDLFGARFPRWSRRLFLLREALRVRLAASVPTGTRAPDVAAPCRLGDTLERDDAALTWLSCAPADSAGQVVVPGDVDAAPEFVFRGDVNAIPAGALLLTRELYPELAAALPRVAGVLCEGGAVGSHLAILAREQRVPLRIQVSHLFDGRS